MDFQNGTPCGLEKYDLWQEVKASLVTQMVKDLPAVQETWAQSLGWKDPLEKGMATQSSILVQWIPGTEGPGGLQRLYLFM